MELKLELLREMPIFGGIRDDTLTFLLQGAPTVSIRKGDYFFHEGDDALSMFVLQKGKVAVLKHWKGRRYRLGHLKTGDCFGEMALSDLFPRSASVRAVKDCTAIELSSPALYEICTRDLEQFAMVQMNIARELSRRLRCADETLFRGWIADIELTDENLSILT